MKLFRSALIPVCMLLNVAPVFGALTDGLVSYWSMDATNGSAVPDLSFNNAMSIIGGTTNIVGQYSNAMSFNGSTVAASASGLTNMHTFDNTDTGLPIYAAGSYTLAMWVKGPGQTNRYIFSESSTGHEFPVLLLRSGNHPLTNRLSILVRNNRNQALVNSVVSSNAVLDNSWHHFAWVDDRGKAKLYIDGVEDPASTNNAYEYIRAYNDLLLNTTTLGTRVYSNNTASFSTNQPLVGTANTFNGQMDEVGLWERALTAAEVADARLNGIYPPQGTPVPARGVTLSKVPADTTKRTGDWHLLSVDAGGTRPISYQWSSNGLPIMDATNRYYRVLNLQPANSGDYYSCALTNLGGSGFAVTTNAAFTVTSDPAPDPLVGLVNYWPLDVFDANTNSPDLHFGHYMRMFNMNTNTDIFPGQFSNCPFFLANATVTNSTFGVRTGGSPIYNRTNYSVALWVNGTGSGQGDRRVFSEGRDAANNNPLFTLGTDNQPVGYPQTTSLYPFVRNDAGVGSPIVGRLSTRPVFDGAWHHVVWTDANGQGKLYVDGVLDETEYTYIRPTNITLNITYIGVAARTTAGNVPAPVTPFTGKIDEVATWNRVLTWTEIQQIRTNGVPIPGSVILAPVITVQPEQKTNNVFVNDDVTFHVQVDGTPPLFYQWRKGTTPISAALNPSAVTDTLILTNVQVADSNTTYFVVITNESGSVTSIVSRMYVLPVTPITNGEVLRLDVGLSGSPNPQPGFAEFTLTNNPGSYANEVRVTMTGIGTALADRNRITGAMVTNNPPLMTQAQIYNDFVFANSTADATGMEVLIERLAANTPFGLTVWSFDPQSNGARFGDWSEITAVGSATITNGYSFDGLVQPTVDFGQTFGGLLTSSAEGKLRIRGLKNGGTSFGVFVNAIRLVANPVATGITKAAVAGGNLQLTTETEYAGMAPNLEQTANVATGPWVPATGGTIISSVGPVVVVEFPIDPTMNLFYRGKRKP